MSMLTAKLSRLLVLASLITAACGDGGSGNQAPDAGDEDPQQEVPEAGPDAETHDADADGGRLPVLAIAPHEVPLAYEDAGYELGLAVAGPTQAPYAWELSEGELPPGLSLAGAEDAATITGTPTSRGTFDFTVRVRDAAGQTAEAVLQLRVAKAPWMLLGVAAGAGKEDLVAAPWLWAEAGEGSKLNEGYQPVTSMYVVGEEPLTTGLPGYAPSADGQHLWFSAAKVAEGPEDLVAVELSTNAASFAQQVVDSGDAYAPVAYGASLGAPALFAYTRGGQLFMADRTGTTLAAPQLVSTLAQINSVAHSSDGQYLLYGGKNGAAQAVQLVRVGESALSSPVTVAGTTAGELYVGGAFIEGAERAAVFSYDADIGRLRLVLVDYSAWPTLDSFEVSSELGSVTGTTDGKWLIYSKPAASGQQLWALDLASDSHHEEPVTGVMDDFWGTTVRDSAGNVFFSAKPANSSQFQVFRVQLSAAGASAPVPLTDESEGGGGLVESLVDDGHGLVFSRCDAEYERTSLQLIDAASTGVAATTQLGPSAPEGGSLSLGRASPDGRWLPVSTREPDQQPRLHLVDVSDLSAPRSLDTGAEAQPWSMNWSPDSQNLAYENEAGGHVLRVVGGALGTPLPLAIDGAAAYVRFWMP